MNFVLDDGDVDLFTIVDTEASGITFDGKSGTGLLNTADLTREILYARLQNQLLRRSGSQVAVENKGDKADVSCNQSSSSNTKY